MLPGLLKKGLSKGSTGTLQACLQKRLDRKFRSIMLGALTPRFSARRFQEEIFQCKNFVPGVTSKFKSCLKPMEKASGKNTRRS